MTAAAPARLCYRLRQASCCQPSLATRTSKLDNARAQRSPPAQDSALAKPSRFRRVPRRWQQRAWDLKSLPRCIGAQNPANHRRLQPAADSRPPNTTAHGSAHCDWPPRQTDCCAAPRRAAPECSRARSIARRWRAMLRGEPPSPREPHASRQSRSPRADRLTARSSRETHHEQPSAPQSAFSKLRELACG